MNKTLAKIFDDLKKIHLPQEERGQLRENIVSYMRAHSLADAKGNQPHEHALGVFAIFTLFLRKPALVALSLTLIISLGLGISVTYAAEQTLPGDALYFVKVNINEEIPKLFLPQEAKARWEVQR